MTEERPSGPTGRFITVEGGDGSGKSSQVRLLADRLTSCGRQVLVTREPGGSEGAEAIRELFVNGPPDRWDAVCEALLIYAARRDHVTRAIAPALARGDWVVCDRFSDSTMAYQGAAGGLGSHWISELDRSVMAGLPRPDLTVIVDVPTETALARAAGRGGADRFERFGASFHRTLRDAFLAIAASEPERCRVVDGDRDMEIVADEIWQLVSDRFDEAATDGR